MKSIIRPLTEAEQDRLIEIDFYLFIQHLLNSYNHSVLSIDVIESLAQLFNCNITFLKRIAQEIHAQTSPLIPSKQELMIMMYRTNMSTRNIRDKFRVHQQTLYRYLDEYVRDGQFEYVYKLDEEELVILKSFMIQLKQLLDWR